MLYFVKKRHICLSPKTQLFFQNVTPSISIFACFYCTVQHQLIFYLCIRIESLAFSWCKYLRANCNNYLSIYLYRKVFCEKIKQQKQLLLYRQIVPVLLFATETSTKEILKLTRKIISNQCSASPYIVVIDSFADLIFLKKLLQLLGQTATELGRN